MILCATLMILSCIELASVSCCLEVLVVGWICSRAKLLNSLHLTLRRESRGGGGGVISHSSAEAIFSLAKSTSPYIGQRVCMMS